MPERHVGARFLDSKSVSLLARADFELGPGCRACADGMSPPCGSSIARTGTHLLGAQRQGPTTR